MLNSITENLTSISSNVEISNIDVLLSMVIALALGIIVDRKSVV